MTHASRPNRITFEADDDVAEILSALPKRDRRAFLNEAVRRRERPPYRLRRAQSDAEAVEQLTSFIELARDEIVLVGMSLNLLIESCGELLERKVRERVGLTVITLQPDIAPGSALYSDLLQRAGGGAYARRIADQVRRSHAFFGRIREIGADAGTPVIMRTCSEIPMCGFLIRDRKTPLQFMRVNIYSAIAVERRHPFFEIDPSVPGGDEVYDIFYSFYEGLVIRTTAVLEES